MRRSDKTLQERRLGVFPPAIFRYGVTPASVPFTDNPAQPSIVTLMVTVLNSTQDNVACSRLVFVIPAGPDVSDLIAEDYAGYVDARPAKGTAWQIVSDKDGIFTATPAGGATGLDAGDAIAFEFERVRVNGLAGPAPIIVWEETDQLREGHLLPDPVKVTPRLSITKFTANPIQVLPDGPVMLSWDSFGASAATLAWEGRSIPVGPKDSYEVKPAADTRYILTVYGQETSASAVIEVLVTTVRILRFSVVELAVPQGGPATLRWEITNANEALLDFEPVDPARGVKLITPSEPRRYYLSAHGPSGSVGQFAEVNVKKVEILQFTATPTFIEPGQEVTLAWETRWSIGASISPDVGAVAGEGTALVKPENDTIYVLAAQGYKGPIEKAAPKVVVAPVVIDAFVVEPKSIAPGQFATLLWKTTRATQVNIDHGVGDVAVSGEHKVNPMEPTGYTLTAFGPNGPKIAQISLDVRSVRFISAYSDYRRHEHRAIISWRTLYCTHVDLQEPRGGWIRNQPPNGEHVFSAFYDDDRWLLRAYGAGKSPVDTVVYLIWPS